jgi:hypothetical protein
MKDLDEVLSIVTAGCDEIEALVRCYSELEPDLTYLPIPLTIKGRNLIATIDVIRVVDNIPIFSYDVVLCKDSTGQFTIAVMGYETLCTTKEQFQKFERHAAVGIDSLPALESMFPPEKLTVDAIESDFVEKFNSITQNIYAISNAIP